MKKLLILLAGVIGYQTAEARYMTGSELSLRLADNSPFTLTFDNQYYSAPSNTYQVKEIMPGSHHLRVTRMMLNPWGGYGAATTVFDGCVNIPAASCINAMINQCNQYAVVSTVAMGGNCGNGYGNGYGNNNGCGNGNGWGNGGYDNNGYGNGGYGNGGYGGGNGGYGNGGYGNGGWGNGGNGGYGNGGYGNGGYGNGGWNHGMSQHDFDALKNSINQKSFDSSKLTLAKQAVSANHLTSQQVSELLGLFSFDSSRLDLAKYAYSNTVDKQNYYVVSNAFTFDSSATELENYISSHS